MEKDKPLIKFALQTSLIKFDLNIDKLVHCSLRRSRGGRHESKEGSVQKMAPCKPCTRAGYLRHLTKKYKHMSITVKWLSHQFSDTHMYTERKSLHHGIAAESSTSLKLRSSRICALYNGYIHGKNGLKAPSQKTIKNNNKTNHTNKYLLSTIYHELY